MIQLWMNMLKAVKINMCLIRFDQPEQELA